MQLDPTITIICDNCQTEIEMGLTAIARGGWDDRDINKSLEREGWPVFGSESHYCLDCAKLVKNQNKKLIMSDGGEFQYDSTIENVSKG